MLEVKNLTKIYGDNKSVSDISLSIGEGETIGLLGPNGAGKSTTMKMLTGYLTPTSGTISLNGTDVSENPIEARKYIGYLPEIPPLYVDMTVTEHLKFVCSLRQIPKTDIKTEIEKVCSELNILDVSKRLIKNLSKGYRQRVGFASALIGDPKLLILDEPTVGLDPAQIVEIRNLIQKLSGKITIIISSHILSEISSVCDRIIILNKGNVVADGSPSQIEADYAESSRIEIEIKGDPSEAEKILQLCINNRATLSHIKTMQNGTAHFLVTAPVDLDLREEIFKAFAEYATTEGTSITPQALLTLHTLNLTLEDIFMDIVKGR